jgi:hypothetical protein
MIRGSKNRIIEAGGVKVRNTPNKKKCVFCDSVFCNQNTKTSKNLLKTHLNPNFFLYAAIPVLTFLSPS